MVVGILTDNFNTQYESVNSYFLLYFFRLTFPEDVDNSNSSEIVWQKINDSDNNSASCRFNI